MTIITCVQKFRDKRNNIIGYKLRDSNGKVKDVRADELKKYISEGKVTIDNLTLTSDGRLISVEPKSSSTINRNTREDKNFIKKVAKALMYIESSLLDMGDSLDELVQDKCYIAGDDIDAYDVEDIFEDDPRFKDCNGNWDMLIRLGEIEFAKVAAKEPDKIQKDLMTYVFEYGQDEYLEERILDGEKDTANIKDTELYKSMSIVLEYAKMHDLKKLIDSIGEFLSRFNTIDFNVLSTVTNIAHNYFRYLDQKIFGTTSNDCATVGHKITESDIKDFNELKGKLYVCHCGFNVINGPKLSIDGIFSQIDDKTALMEVKLNREGYIGESCVGKVGYFKDVTELKIDCTRNIDELTKEVAELFNKTGNVVIELCKKYPELTKIKERSNG